VCIDPHQTVFVGKGSDHLQLIKFWPSCTPRKGSAEGWKFLAPPYYSQRAVSEHFFITFSYVNGHELTVLYVSPVNYIHRKELLRSAVCRAS